MTDYQDLLIKTSRTFALSIPVLEEPMRDEVTIAYLLFRIADTFEDAYVWPKERRVQALRDFAGLLDDYSREEAERLTGAWAEEPPTEHEGYLELLRETPAVLERWNAYDADSREVLRHHTVRTSLGMAEFVERSDDHGRLRLRDMDDLSQYCYVVAGIVGELLTDLFLLREPSLEPIAEPLRDRAATFGEALQLVNILKDAADDAEEGRTFLPPDLDLAEVFARARHDLGVAQEYVTALQENGASRGAVAFTALPVLLAWETLETVERDGPGSKVTRPRVAEIVAGLQSRLDSNQPAVGTGS